METAGRMLGRFAAVLYKEFKLIFIVLINMRDVAKNVIKMLTPVFMKQLLLSLSPYLKEINALYQVLEPIARRTKEQCLSQALEEKEQAPREDMMFVREGAESSTIKKQKEKQVRKTKLLAEHEDWQMVTDLGGMMSFPRHIAITYLRPDIVVWSDQGKELLLIELTVPWDS